MPGLVRHIAGRLHRWVGLATALLLVPVGLTGAVLVYDDEIDRALHPELLRVTPAGPPAPADWVVAAVEAAFPGRAIARLEVPGRPDATWEAILAGDGRQVFVDPYRVRVLGSHLPTETFTGLLFAVHVHLLAGAAGKVVVGVLGLLLLGLSATGLVLWWRGRRRMADGLRVRLRAKPLVVHFDLHRAVGFVALAPLVVVAFTGAGLVFYAAFDRAAHTLTGTPAPAPPPRSTAAAGPGASLDTVLARARRALPEARLARVDLPAAPDAAWRVRLRMPGEAHPVGLSMVYVDRYSGAVLRAESAPAARPARRLGIWYYPLHIGAVGGPAVRVLYALVGLALPMLAVTGVAFWWLRRRKPASRRREARAPAAPDARRRVPTSGA